MPTSKESAAAVAATAANDAIAGQAAVAAQQAILARQAAAAAAQRAEFTYIAGLPPNRRTVSQNTRLAVFLGNAPRTQHAGPTALHALSTAVQVMEVPRGGTVYRMNDPCDGFYVVVDGRIILYDVKDKDEAEEDDGVVERLGRSDSFGEEDLLSNSRRAHRADVTPDASALLIRVPPELYRKYLQHLHQPDFEDKVDFLAQLEVFRSLPDETLRKLAPCFAQVELRAREYLVRQGERADSMYAIASGQCSVLVDPGFRPEQGGLAESDPKKAMQVCLIGPGNIVGDMTVLANVRKRTASILCLSDLICYKIRRATFIRRVPSIQLEALRQVAEAKLRITERHLHSAVNGNSGSTAKGAVTLRDKLLRGQELRQLSQPAAPAALELRGLPPGTLSSGVENLIATSLAAVAAAVGGGAGAGGGAAVGSGGAASGSALGAAAAAIVASTTAGSAAMGDARMRFGGSRRPSVTVTPSSRGLAAALAAAGGGAAAAAGGGSLQGLVDRSAAAAAAAMRGRSGGHLVPATHTADKVRNTDINFSWGLGPGTLINSLLEPRTSCSGGANGPQADGNISHRRIYPTEGVAAADDSAGGAAGLQDPGGGLPPPARPAIPSLPAPLPSASMQLQPTSSRQNLHHLSFNYGRSGGGFGGQGLRGSASMAAFSQPRWGWTSSPIDTVSAPYTPPSYTSGEPGTAFSVIGVSLGGGIVPGGGGGGSLTTTGVVVGGGGGPGGFGALGAGVSSGGGFVGVGLRRGGVRSAHQIKSATLPYIGPEKLGTPQDTTNNAGRRSFSGVYGSGGGGMPSAGLQRPGPLVIGPAAPPGIPPPTPPPQPQQPPLLQLLQPGSSRPPSQPQRSPSPFAAAELQQPPSVHASGSPSPSPFAAASAADQRARTGSGGGDVAAGGRLEVPATPDGGMVSFGSGGGFAAAASIAASAAGTDTPWSPRTGGHRSGTSSPARSRYGDACQQPDQKWGGGGDEMDFGSDGECLTPTRREAVRRQKSMGKMRFSRKIVTQNSSVDALVAEAIVSAMTKDVLLKQARAAEDAISREAEEAARRGEPLAVDVPVGDESATGSGEVVAAGGERGDGGGSGGGGGGGGGGAGDEGASGRPEDGAGVAGEDGGDGAGVRTSLEASGGEAEAAEAGESGESGEGAGERAGASAKGEADGFEGRGDGEGEGDRAESGRGGGGVVAEDGAAGEAGGTAAAAEGGEQTAAAADAEVDKPEESRPPPSPQGGDPAAEAAGEPDMEAAAATTGTTGAEAEATTGPVQGESGAETEATEAAGSAQSAADGRLEGDAPEAAAASPEAEGGPPRAEASSPQTADGAASAAAADGQAGGGADGEEPAAPAARPNGPAPDVEASRMSDGSEASRDCSPSPRRQLSAFSASASASASAPGEEPWEGHNEPPGLQRPPSLGQSHSQGRRSSDTASRRGSGAGSTAGVPAAPACEGPQPQPQPQPQAQPQPQPPNHPQPHPPSASTASSGRTAPGGANTGGGGGGAAAAAGPVRAVSRQPTTLQLTLPDAMGPPSSRQGGGLSPPRRQLTPPVGPRPYPYVGPFLSLKKSLPLPANLLASGPNITPPAVNKTPSFSLRVGAPPSTSPAASPTAAAGGAVSPGAATAGAGAGAAPYPPCLATAALNAERAGGSGEWRGSGEWGGSGEARRARSGGSAPEGLHAVAAVGLGAGAAATGSGGSVGGFYAGGGSGGTRGQLRKGGALYRGPLASRNASTSP